MWISDAERQYQAAQDAKWKAVKNARRKKKREKPKEECRIPLSTWSAVRRRSRGVCEECGERKAVQMHHLTYIRRGRERKKDLRNLCLECHIAEHPEKEKLMRKWESERTARKFL